MTIWILDTDHVSHLLQGNKVVSSSGAKKPGFFSQTFGENKISLRNPVSYSMEVRSRF
ncbi:hypothetical protein [Planktothrix serta]|uniref:hypothetical protein n=1 Tax=Planktothrix serta TaxID=1678310 RepID=UPI0018CC1A15|nr:hypothetical protein [Planktothrix serta]